LETPRPLGALIDVAEQAGGELATFAACDASPAATVRALSLELRRRRSVMRCASGPSGGGATDGDARDLSRCNPCFVTEVLAVAADGGAVPDTVRDVVLARAARLAAGSRGCRVARAMLV
jgi:hypothetical protein